MYTICFLSLYLKSSIFICVTLKITNRAHFCRQLFCHSSCSKQSHEKRLLLLSKIVCNDDLVEQNHRIMDTVPFELNSIFNHLYHTKRMNERTNAQIFRVLMETLHYKQFVCFNLRPIITKLTVCGHFSTFIIVVNIHWKYNYLIDIMMRKLFNLIILIANIHWFVVFGVN